MGTDSLLREFLRVEDMGEACLFALENCQPGPEDQRFLNVVTAVDLTIRELAEAVAKATRFLGISAAMPESLNGTPKKQLDVNRLAKLG